MMGLRNVHLLICNDMRRERRVLQAMLTAVTYVADSDVSLRSAGGYLH